MNQEYAESPSAIIAGLLQESIWSPLFFANREDRLARLAAKDDPLPRSGGIYRLNLLGLPILAYVGQTGDIRRRINELRGVAGEHMPYTDPHIAAPSLWAWQQFFPGIPLVVSFVSLSCSAYWRQGYEDLVIACERRALKAAQLPAPWDEWHSPLANYHKLPSGWISSSSRAKAFRGGPSPILSECHTPGIVPVGDLYDERDPLDDLNWGGHIWSSWCYAREARNQEEVQGLYRLRRADDSRLFFLGHGCIDDAAYHAARTDSSMLLSYTPGDWNYHEQLELLTDIIALYLRQTNTLPLAQYGGERNPHAGSEWPLPE